MPPVGFYFSLQFGSKSSTGDLDAAFQEVSGLSTNLETKEIVEGGENRFVHQVPVRTKFTDLVLKRGFIPARSDLARWVSDTLNSNMGKPIEPQDITLHLLNEKHDPLTTWTFVKAYPVKWEFSNLDAEKSAIVTESITFKYQYFQLIQRPQF